jgi:hypothetical protein
MKHGLNMDVFKVIVNQKFYVNMCPILKHCRAMSIQSYLDGFYSIVGN